jgi:hypothetical protein
MALDYYGDLIARDAPAAACFRQAHGLAPGVGLNRPVGGPRRRPVPTAPGAPR